MAVTLNSSGITFSDGSSQNTAASSGVPSSSIEQNYNNSGNFAKPANAFAVLVGLASGGQGGGEDQSPGGQEYSGSGGQTCLAYVPTGDFGPSVPVAIGNGGAEHPYRVRGASGGSSNFAGLVSSNSGITGSRSIFRSSGDGGNGSNRNGGRGFATVRSLG